MKDETFFNILDAIRKRISAADTEKSIEIISDELSRLPQYFEPHLKLLMFNITKNELQAEIAIQEIINLTELYPDEISIIYFCGEFLVENECEYEAIEYLKSSISMAHDKNDSWYLDSAILLLSYCYLQSGDREKSSLEIRKLNDNVSMEWLNTKFPLSKRAVENNLRRGSI